MAKIRYSWWSGRPKNISRQENDRYNLLKFSLGLSGGIGLLCSYNLFFGGLDSVPNTLEQTEEYSLAKALDYQGDRTEAYKFQGRLVTETPVAMPDDAALEVIAGQLKVVVNDHDDILEPLSLIDWEHTAPKVFLEKDNVRIPVNLDLAVFSREKDIIFDKDIIYETGGSIRGSVRDSKSIAVEYEGERYDLPPEYSQLKYSSDIEITREYLIQGQKFVILAGLQNTEKGPAIVPPLGEKAQAFKGYEEEINDNVDATRPWLIFWIIGCGAACYFLGQQYAEARQEIIRQSNL